MLVINGLSFILNYSINRVYSMLKKINNFQLYLLHLYLLCKAVSSQKKKCSYRKSVLIIIYFKRSP